MDWKQYESTTLIYFCMADRLKKKLDDEAFVLKEIQEMKCCGTFRTIALVGMRISEENGALGSGGDDINANADERNENL